MVRYTGRRLVSGLLTLFLFVTLLFFVINMVTPGDWVSQFILTAEGAEALREELSLNRPLWQQYLSWLVGLVTLNLGTSFGRGDVWDAIVAALPSTLLVLAIGLTLAFVLGGWLGRVSAYKGKSLASGSMTFVAIVFLTAFPPVLAILMEQGIRSTFGFVFLGRLGSLRS
jgi:ABC-type dipeptide/oligopeptide/nickel transport system permease component